jgi:ubiquinone/menaquinone biosynthesis C-methylase UbiE
MASRYAGGNATAYEQMMGRWSQRLAKPFLDFAAIGEVDSVLDMGCGTGSLTFALADAAPKAKITGVDASQAFVDYAKLRTSDPRLAFVQGDATKLPYADCAFSAALSLLVLNFVPSYEKAAREMVRVTRPGGVAAASVWDFRGGLTYVRMFLDTAAALDPNGDATRAKIYSMPLIAPDELAQLWTKIGFREVKQTSLTIRMDFQSFADYWKPWLGGQGTVGPYAASLDGETKAKIEHHLRLAYVAGGQDGPRSFAATAWAVRGIR